MYLARQSIMRFNRSTYTVLQVESAWVYSLHISRLENTIAIDNNGHCLINSEELDLLVGNCNHYRNQLDFVSSEFNLEEAV